MAGSAPSFPCEYLLAMSMVKQEINGTGRLLVPPLQKYVQNRNLCSYCSFPKYPMVLGSHLELHTHSYWP